VEYITLTPQKKVPFIESPSYLPWNVDASPWNVCP